MKYRCSQSDLFRAAEIVAARTGLHFSGERLKDMERGILSAANELGFSNPAACFDWLLKDSMQHEDIETLASFLTIGETFFYRDRKCFNAFREKMLSSLIDTRSEGGRNIRIWSAGCCTGEEPYTIAIILREIIKDINHWNITIRATDINRRFLKKAVNGIYTDWSFRDTPPSFRKFYFRQTGEKQYELLPEIRKLVDFSMLNLADNVYPSVITNTNAMDIIFCRNVLMYFTSEQAVKVIQRLYNSMNDSGFLVVSPFETSLELFSKFEPVYLNDLIFYRKCATSQKTTDIKSDDLQSAIYKSIITPGKYAHETTFIINHDSADEETCGTIKQKAGETVITGDQEGNLTEQKNECNAASEALTLFKTGNYRETVNILLQLIRQDIKDTSVLILLSRAYANLGELDEARRWCEKAINLEKLNAEYYHLLSVILIEQNEPLLAENNLIKALYSDPDLTIAHFTLGNLVKSQGREMEANKHFSNTLKILSKHDPDELVPGAEGMTAGSLTEIIRTFT